MQFLKYNEFFVKGLSSKLKKVEKMLREGDFKLVEVKKIKYFGYFCIKFDCESCLLFKFVKYQGEIYILLLEVIFNYEYDKFWFLRGVFVKENYFSEVVGFEDIEEDIVELIWYVNQVSKWFYLLDKVILLDSDQEEIYNLFVLFIIIGLVGSGKIVLILEKMKGYFGYVVYVFFLFYLVENVQCIYEFYGYENFKQEIDFFFFWEYLEGI